MYKGVPLQVHCIKPTKGRHQWIQCEKKMLPCAELLLPERSAEAILQLGIMPIVSFRNRDMARLLRFQSVAEPLTSLQGPWE